jgi:hypothetical protein
MNYHQYACDTTETTISRPDAAPEMAIVCRGVKKGRNRPRFLPDMINR